MKANEAKVEKVKPSRGKFFTACYRWENKGTLIWIPKRS